MRASTTGSTNRAPASMTPLDLVLQSFAASDAPRSYIPERGTGTASSSRSISVSVVTPSDCAWKLVSTRWRSTGCASARMSSKLTW